MFAALLPALSLTAVIYMIIKLGLIGFIVWLITKYIPMPDIFKTIIYVIVAIALILYVISVLNIG